MNMMYVILGGLIVVGVVIGVLLYMGLHDDEIRLRNSIADISCDYLRNDFMPEEEQKYFKHPWYPYAVEKLNSEECKWTNIS